MLKTIFLNGDSLKQQCSVYQAGLQYYDALKHSTLLDLTYCDVANTSPSPWSLPDPAYYDLAIINYAFGTLGNLPLTYVELFKKRAALTNDMYYESPWEFLSHLGDNREVFNFIFYPDPTLTLPDDNVCALPRVCPRIDIPEKKLNSENPTISTYGFPSPEKQLFLASEIIKMEFEKATWRLHFPEASHQGWDMKEFMRQVFEICKETAGPNVKCELSSDFKSTEEMIRWLAESDLNIFLHHPKRFYITKGALPASIDLAVSAQRPISFSESMENRHLLPYQLPYPQLKFKPTIEAGYEAVKAMYEDWSPLNFAKTVDAFLEKHF